MYVGAISLFFKGVTGIYDPVSFLLSYLACSRITRHNCQVFLLPKIFFSVERDTAIYQPLRHSSFA